VFATDPCAIGYLGTIVVPLFLRLISGKGMTPKYHEDLHQTQQKLPASCHPTHSFGNKVQTEPSAAATKKNKTYLVTYYPI
jgi:hypothetical protein